MIIRTNGSTYSLTLFHMGEIIGFLLCATALLSCYEGVPLWRALILHIMGVLVYFIAYLSIVRRVHSLDMEVKSIYQKNYWSLLTTLALGYWQIILQGLCGLWLLIFSFAIAYRSWYFRDMGGHPVPLSRPAWKDWRFYTGW